MIRLDYSDDYDGSMVMMMLKEMTTACHIRLLIIMIITMLMMLKKITTPRHIRVLIIW